MGSIGASTGRPIDSIGGVNHLEDTPVNSLPAARRHVTRHQWGLEGVHGWPH
jgi:hypothetical protein